MLPKQSDLSPFLHASHLGHLYICDFSSSCFALPLQTLHKALHPGGRNVQCTRRVPQKPTPINSNLTAAIKENNRKKISSQRSEGSMQPALLAELVEDLLEHENRASAAKDGERLASKEGIHNASHGRAQQ